MEGLGSHTLPSNGESDGLTAKVDGDYEAFQCPRQVTPIKSNDATNEHGDDKSNLNIFSVYGILAHCCLGWSYGGNDGGHPTDG